MPRKKPIRDAIEKLLTEHTAQEIVAALIASAKRKKPDVAAAAFLRDSLEGRPSQSLEITSKVDLFTRIEEARQNAGKSSGRS
jgi:hypothetical protein